MRLFVAIDFPASVKDAAAAFAERLRPSIPEARWVPRDNLHVTTKFLGQVPDERLAEIAAAAARAASGMVAFEARLGDAGVFPSPKRARVLWLGIDDPAGGFSAVATACEEAYAPLGFEPERRAFVPHLTVARLRVPSPVSVPEAAVGGVRFGVDRLTLFRSHLRRPAPVYEELAVYPFGLGG